jgi:CRISPR/Cas system-associated exonuclease Cas4 (RecB family)
MSEILLSATLYQRFLTCPSSAAFSVDPNAKRFLKPSLKGLLGIVAHKLVEQSMHISNELSHEQVAVWFEKQWQFDIEEQYAELKKHWFPNIAPKPESWPGYFATRASAKSLVLKNSNFLSTRYERPSKSKAGKIGNESLELPLVEKFLRSDSLAIVGKPDLVFLEKEKATIYDYKFSSNQDDIEKHKIQMLFYQLLVEEVVKIKVGRMAIVASSSRIYEIPNDIQESNRIRTDIPRVLNALKTNKVVAIPSVSNCKYCPFKSICEPFKSMNLEIHPNLPMAISGKVLNVSKVGNGIQELIIGPKSRGRGEPIKVFGVPENYAIEPGATVFLADNLEYRDPSTIGFAWNSRIFIQD